MALKGFKIFVSGRVQGVGFRDFTARVAHQLRITGYVKNLSNGNVYVRCFGEEDILTRFVGHLKKGPMYANVRDIKLEEIEYNSAHRSFKVQY